MREVTEPTAQPNEHPLIALQTCADKAALQGEVEASIKDETDPFLLAAINGDTETMHQMLATDWGWLEHANAQGLTALHLSIITDQTHAIVWLLECEPYLTCKDALGRTPLYFATLFERDNVIDALQKAVGKRFFEQDAFFCAVILDDAPTVLRHLQEKRKYEITTFNQLGKSCLHVAAEHGNNRILRLLMQEPGADVNFPSKDTRGSFKRLPIHFAAKCGHATTIELLIQLGSRLNDKDVCGDMPLHLAAAEGWLQAVIVLCDNNAAINATNELQDSAEAGRTALHIAIVKKRFAIALELLRRQANFDTVDSEHNTPLTSAQKALSFAKQTLAEWTADSDEDDAAEAVDPQALQTLQDEIDGFQQIIDEITRIARAQLDGSGDEAEQLREMLRLDEADGEGNTKLHDLAADDEADQLAALLELGADLNAQNDKGRTPSATASLRGSVRSLKLLKKKGARPSILDGDGRNILHLAAKRGHGACITAARPWFGNIDQGDEDENNTPLHLAARKHQLAAMQALLAPIKIDDEEQNDVEGVRQQLGADPNARNKSEETPFHLLVSVTLDYDSEDEEEAVEEKLQHYNEQLANEIELLLRYGGRVDLTDYCNQSVLDVANGNDHISEENKQRLVDAFEQQKGTPFIPRSKAPTVDEATEDTAVAAQPSPEKSLPGSGVGSLRLTQEQSTDLNAALLQMNAETEAKAAETKAKQPVAQNATITATKKLDSNPAHGSPRQLVTVDDDDDDDLMPLAAAGHNADEHSVDTLTALTPTDAVKNVAAEPDDSNVAEALRPYVRSLRNALASIPQTSADTEPQSTYTSQQWDGAPAQPAELSAFIEQLATASVDNIGTTCTDNGNNLLHFIAAHDPEGLLLPTLQQLPQETIAELVRSSNYNSESPIHSACRHHHLPIFEFCVASLDQTNLADAFYDIVINVTMMDGCGHNAYHLVCLSAFNSHAQQIKALFDDGGTELNPAAILQHTITPCPVDPATLQIMGRFREILGERNDELVLAEDYFQHTPLMLCCYVNDASLVKGCLNAIQVADKRRKAVTYLNEHRKEERDQPSTAEHDKWKYLYPIQFAAAFCGSESLEALLHTFGRDQYATASRRLNLLHWSYLCAEISQHNPAQQRLTGVVEFIVYNLGDDLARASIKRPGKPAYLIYSLHSDHLIARKLLAGEEPIDRRYRYQMLVELLVDLADYKPLQAANSARTSPRSSSGLFAPTSPDSARKLAEHHAKTIDYRRQLIAKLFQFTWPDEVVHTLALTIAASSRHGLDNEYFNHKGVFFDFIVNRSVHFSGRPADERYATLACALFYSLPTKKTPEIAESSTAINVGNCELVATAMQMTFINKFKETGMISCVQELYLKLRADNQPADGRAIQNELACVENQFLARIYQSRSILRAAILYTLEFTVRSETTTEENFVRSLMNKFTTTKEDDFVLV